jgi:quercetin 2,3-dioxygenase
MLTLRKAADRGHFDHGWLDTHHTFSFGEYHDPAHMGFRTLRVINDDVVAPGQGFGMHPHRDMEIITWVLQGALEHKDSLGSSGVLKPGDVQVMSAGSGIRHSEFNHSSTEPVHLIQTWIMPKEKGIAPRYAQRTMPAEGRRDRFQLLASPDGAGESLPINQDATVSVATLKPGAHAKHALNPSRHAWLHVARGELKVNGADARAGDGIAITGEPTLALHAGQPGAELLLFDLA